jgi:anti-sigma regulatory factor (Ser/Thr protein kinase)
MELHSPLRLPVEEKSQAAEVRRLAVEMAKDLRFSETRVGEIAIVATEAGNNLAVHARQGEVLLSSGEAVQGPYLEVLSIDRGPGMDVARCLRDGFSTAGTAGTGLGAMKRLADLFDVYSSEMGTVLLARFERERTRFAPVVVGAARASKPGESACGDAFSVRHVGSVTAVLVSDGLGHGPFAADASNDAIAVFRTAPWYGAAAMVTDIHAALRGSRGAAVAVAAIEHDARRVQFSGLGNIAGVLLGAGRNQNMVSFNGTAGHNAAKIGQFAYPWPEGGIMVMHSDGISTSWNLDKYSGLMRHHPGVIAGLLYRDFSRGRDDATAVVVSETHP